MDRAQIFLLGLPLFLFCSDIVNLFASSPPPKPSVHHHHHHRVQPQPVVQQTLDFPTQKPSGIGAIGIGNTVNINFCSSCSCRGTAVTMKNMLETAFPGIDVTLANYPPPLPKRQLGKVVPLFQFGVIGIVMAGEQIFPWLRFVAPPPWYYSLRSNRFGTISTTWLLGNFLQSMLQSSGAFEVYCNGKWLFSKLKLQRFPGEIELKDLVSRKVNNLAFNFPQQLKLAVSVLDLVAAATPVSPNPTFTWWLALDVGEVIYPPFSSPSSSSSSSSSYSSSWVELYRVVRETLYRRENHLVICDDLTIA